ncbi:MAG: glyoxalase [Gammaproteobacteria bacterium]|nr:MAG: glyoxalase [Gammaproteobacteria bacterium]
MNQSNTQITQGVHHVGLTIPSLAQTLSFFEDVLGFKKVGEKPDYPAAFISDGTTMLTLWQTKPKGDVTSFDRHQNIGLHHLALSVTSKKALHDLHALLINTPDVTIEFAPEASGSAGVEHMMCLIPGGPRVEFRAEAE